VSNKKQGGRSPKVSFHPAPANQTWTVRLSLCLILPPGLPKVKEDLRMKVVCRSILVTLILINLLGIAFAQEEKKKEEKKLIKLEEVIVTATRTEKSLEDVPCNATVITRKEIEKSGARSIDQILKTQAGLITSRPHGVTSSSNWGNMFLRGFYDQKRTLILLDGVPLNGMYYGGVYIDEIPVEDIERIEVVRGASSALYGSRAMGGVINIITRKPEKKLKFTLINNYETELETWDNRFSLCGRKGKWGFWLTKGIMETDGYIATLKKYRKPPYEENRDKRKDDFMVKITYDIDPYSTLTFTSNYYHERVGAGRKFYYGGEVHRRYNLNYKRKSAINWEANFRFSDIDYWWIYDTYRADKINKKDHSPQKQWDAFIQATFSLNSWNLITMGADYRRGEVEMSTHYRLESRSAKTEGKQQLASFFFQDELSLLSDKLLLTLGGRFDWYENFDGSWWDSKYPPKRKYGSEDEFSFNPKFGVLYHLTEGTALRASIGRAFAAPTLYELYRTSTWWGSEYRGNPDLDPEKNISYEVGVNQNIGEDFLGKLTFFYNDAEDFITTVFRGSEGGMDIYQRENVGDVETSGLEVEARYRLSPSWSFFANYTYTHTEIEEADQKPELEGKRLQRIPRHKAAFGITFADPKLFTLSLVGNYMGSRYYNVENTKRLNDYFTLDLKLIRKITNHTEIGLEVNDLNNKTWRESYKYETPGRTINIRFKTEF